MEDLIIQCTDEQELKEKQLLIRNNSYQALFLNDDDSHNIVHEKQQTIKEGDYFNSFNMISMQVVSVINTRPHKGVFENENHRKQISRVTARKVKFTL